MSRQTKLTHKELGNLCAYMDNALTEKEKAAFEARLAKSLPLQKKLKEYRQLKMAVQQLPAKPAPRNFILTAEQAHRIKPKPVLYPAFSYAALTVMLLLALVFTSEFIFNNFSIPQAEVPQETAMLMMEAADEETVEKESAPQIFTWAGGGAMGGGVEGMGGGGYGGSGLSGVTIVSPAEEGVAEEPLLQAEGMSAEEPAPESKIAEDTAADSNQTGHVEPLILGLAAEEAGSVVNTFPAEEPVQVAAVPTEAAETEEKTTWIPAAFKFALAGLALLLGAIALYLYWRR